MVLIEQGPRCLESENHAVEQLGEYPVKTAEEEARRY